VNAINQKLAMASVVLVTMLGSESHFPTLILTRDARNSKRKIPEAAAIEAPGFWRTLFQINNPFP